MPVARIYDAARRTGEFFYILGDLEIVSETSRKVTFTAPILEGRHAGEIATVEWIGRFDTTAKTGSLTELREFVDGRKHFSLKLDRPVPIEDFFNDPDGVVAGGITFTGNRFANRMEGDRGPDRISGNGGDDLLVGLRGNDRLSGGAGDDILRGGAGRDRLSGGRGNDQLSGGDGDDRLLDHSGRNKLVGGRGDDTLEGGRGNDTFTGGPGADAFLFGFPETPRSIGRDMIADFGRGADTIDLSNVDADTTRLDNQAFVFIGDARFSETAGELRYVRGILAGDRDGDGVSDARIELAGAPALAETDLIL